MDFKLGKKPAQPDPRDLKYAAYAEPLKVIKLVLPARFGYGHSFTDWKMLGNDSWGDCVWAEAAHSTMLWTKIGVPATAVFDDHAVLSDYSAVTGFDPNAGPPDNNPTDQGTDMHQALNYRRHTGVVDVTGKRHQIAAYVSLRPGDWNELLQAIYVFGGVAMGFKFPNSAMTQFNNGQIWDVVPGAQIVGGHDVFAVGTTAKNKKATCITWGQRQEFTRAFYETYADECYVGLSEELLKSDGKGLHGFDLTTLRADLLAL